jgi:putative flavoprotein involved in K+ transport
MLSVARHTRLPRTYRGRDILWWLDRTGIMSERARDAADLAASRNQPSMQLIGTRDRTTIDLGVLHDEGIRIVGSTSGIDGTRIDFEDDLLETTIAADLKLARLRLRIDNHIRAHRLENLAGPEEPFDAMRLPDADTRIDLKAERIDTVVWATGFRRRYPWLRVPVLDRRGEIIHDEGITPADGLYVMGLQFMRRRTSSFIDGVARDAAELSEHLCERRRGCRDAA